MNRIRNTNKQKALLEQDFRIFRTSDLAVLWEIENKNTLWTTISRYLKRKILYKIYKGLYSTTPVEKLDKYELGCAIFGQLSYVSTETVLQNYGIIMQDIRAITFLGKKKKKLKINGTLYICRHLNIKYLLNRTGIESKGRYSIATVDRAIADMLHVSLKYYFDNNIAINTKKIKTISKEIGYKNDYT